MGNIIKNLKTENIYIYKMVNKNELITKFSKYLDKYTDDNSKLDNSKFDTINSIISILDRLIIKYEKEKKKKQKKIEFIKLKKKNIKKKNVKKIW